MKEIDKIIWENALKLAHKKHGWDKNKLAEQMKTNITTLNNIANGTKGAGKVIVNRMAASIGVSIADLLRGEELFQNQTAPPTISNSYPHSVINNSLLQKFCYVLENGSERDKLALEYGVEGVFGRVSRQVEVLETLVEQQKVMIEQQAKQHKELVSLLQSDSGEPGMGEESQKSSQQL